MLKQNKFGQLLTHVKVVKAVQIQGKEVILQPNQPGARVTAMDLQQWNRLHKQYNMHPSLLTAPEGYFVLVEHIPAPAASDVLSFEATEGAELSCVREAMEASKPKGKGKPGEPSAPNTGENNNN